MRVYSLLGVPWPEALTRNRLLGCIPQFGLCEVMRKAIGVAVITEAGAVLRAQAARMIQGGTWSAATCQYTTLGCALPPEMMPKKEVQQVDPWKWGAQRPVGIDYVSACIRARRLVHVDDVMSAGRDARVLDDNRRAFREAAGRQFSLARLIFALRSRIQSPAIPAS